MPWKRCVPSVPWFEVEAPKGIYINLDGEPTHATHHRFEIDAGRLKLHLPESTPLLTHEGET